MTTDLIRADDMIFYKEGEQIMSGGFVVNSSLFDSVIHQASNGKLTGGSENNSDLAVPIGLYFTQSANLSGGKKILYNYDTSEQEEREEISDDIYEQLLKHHITKNEKQQVKPRKTRKHYKNPKPDKNTRRFHKKK